MKSFYLFVIVLLFTGFAKNAEAQNISNEGTDFWMVFPTHDNSGNNPNNNLASMNINVTSKSDSEVTVSCGSSPPITKTIKANTIVTFVIPRPESYINYSEANTWLPNRGIHIVVSPNMPKVVVYGHVFASARSAATLVLPYEALGQKYLSMNYTQDNSNNSLGLPARNFLTLVAADDNTDLIITELSGNKIPVKLPKKGDVYQYMPTEFADLTGTVVEVDQLTSQCKRFAAFSGSTSIAIECFESRDPLLQQLYSVNSWGKTYGIAPFSDRRYIFRVMAQENNTNVKVNGNLVKTLNKGEFYESQTSTQGIIVSADKLISVAQYSLTRACSSLSGGNLVGDPEMILLNPIEFNIKDVTMFSSSQENIQFKYINVFMKTEKTASFKLNGVSAGSWISMAADPTYSYTQIPVFESSLRLTADDGFNAIAYGFGGYESYAYSAGTNLHSTSTLSLLNIGSQLESKTAACLGQSTVLKLSLPYKLTKITWKDSGGAALFPDQPLGLPVESTDNSGTHIFTYNAPNTIIFPNLGVQKITAIAVLSQADLPPCVVGTDIKFDFEIEVVPLGVAKFIVPDICAGTPVHFKDDSSISGNTISQWKWKIDGTQYDVQNPTHTFASKGEYIVELSVANASGCWSDVTLQSISVRKDFPKLEFTAPKPVCFNDIPSQFTVPEKNGLTAAQTLTGFKGKGVTPAGIFNPSVAGVGVHKITYVFSSVEGCTDSVSQNIEVYATTVIDVEPIIYILAGGERMIPASIVSANASYAYKYKWTIGGMPAIGLSRDDVLNPIAFPEKDTKYILTVSVDGLCSVTREVLVKVLDKLDPPNAFSPNDDQVNDVWLVKSLDSYPKAEISIFNRNGQKVFSSIGYTKPFDGNYRGNPLPVGVYYYIIDPKNGRQKITGPLTIIR